MRISLRRCVQRCRRHLTVRLLLLTSLSAIIGLFLVTVNDQVVTNAFFGMQKVTTTPRIPILLSFEQLQKVHENRVKNGESKEQERERRAQLRSQWLKERIEKMTKRVASDEQELLITENLKTNYNVHVFYYAWYETPEVDGKWEHWNHQYIRNWKQSESNNIYPTGSHRPPDDIGANFYPQLGCYSSRDPRVIDIHMRQIKDSGIGVVIVSWYPPSMSDGSSTSPDNVFLKLLNAAQNYGLKVAPHIEPYKHRDPSSFRIHLKYFIDKYASHAALYRIQKNNRSLPVFYIYDSYLSPATSWKEIFGKKGSITVRGTPEDGVFLGLLVEQKHKIDIKRAQFDGFYTYFAANGFSYGSTWKNWKILAAFAKENNLLFFPSLGPGYIDTRVRPWNIATTRPRRNGKYYGVAWRTAIAAGTHGVGITSFNEWHEGTQIEPAVPHRQTSNFTYLDYEPNSPNFYLNLTKYWIKEYSKVVTNNNNNNNNSN